MTWVPNRCLWRKMYRGHVYTISCKALDVPPTKTDSYQVANAWWTQKLATLKNIAIPGRFDHIIKELEARKAWLEANRMDAAHIPSTIAMIREMANDDRSEERRVG